MSFWSYLLSVIKLNKGFSGLSIFEHRRIYVEWYNQVASRKSPLDLELPWISVIAKNYIEAYLREKSKLDIRIFEFGSGGSSLFFSKYASEVISIEHDKEWFNLVREKIKQKQIDVWWGYLIEPELRSGNSSFKLDISDPLHYHSKDKMFLNYSFEEYAKAIERFPDKYFDLVLIDGRSRPSCILHSLNKVKQGGLLVLDNAEREYYLSNGIIDGYGYELVVDSNGALVCYNSFTQTNVYVRSEHG